jgi:3-dehydroquinate dehydratase/shikimate dehydrogenase
MTLLVASLAVEDLQELEVRATRAWEVGADAVELRIDAYDGSPEALASWLAARADRTWIVTCRSAAEGGHHVGDASDRAARLLAAVHGVDACVDVELADWQRLPEFARAFGATKTEGPGVARRVILSSHKPADPAVALRVLTDEATADGVLAAKLAYPVDQIADTFQALDTMHESGASMVAIAMGEDGAWTRVLARKLGAFASYCALDAASATAPGQFTLEEMVHRYRWRAMDASTRVFGVIGDPVAHSMSPLLFNQWFADAGINAVYLPLRVRADGDAAGALRRFLDGCRDRPWLDVGGFSVTLPHKTSVGTWLGDRVDHMARGIGAVNTVSFRGHKTQGFNTDCYAALSSLTAALECKRDDLLGLSVDVLGTGGMARALVYGLPMFGCDVTVYGRSAEATRHLADLFGVRPAAWEDRTRGSGEVLINATSVGLWPDDKHSPMLPESLSRRRLVFDVIYNPLETWLLRDAREAGAATLGGLDMFVRQAAVQFALWTGRSPDLTAGRNLISRCIEQRGGSCL